MRNACVTYPASNNDIIESFVGDVFNLEERHYTGEILLDPLYIKRRLISVGLEKLVLDRSITPMPYDRRTVNGFIRLQRTSHTIQVNGFQCVLDSW